MTLSSSLAKDFEKFSLSCLGVLPQALGQLESFLVPRKWKEGKSLHFSLYWWLQGPVAQPSVATQRQVSLKLPGQGGLGVLSTSKVRAWLFTCYF